MSGTSDSGGSKPTAKGFQFPTAFTILFGLIVIVAAATWIVPAGRYDRV